MRPLPVVAAAACLAASAGVAWAVASASGPGVDPAQALRACGLAENASRQECMVEVFSSLVTEVGPAELFAAYDQVRREDPTVAYVCHEAGHRAGASYFNSSESIVDALDYVGGSCQSAFTHGVFDAWVDSGSVDVESLQQAADVCDTAPDYNALFLCFDGIGHVVYQQSATLEEAFAQCNLSAFTEGLEGCASGILMQKWAPVLPEDRDEAARISDIVDLCRSLAGRWESRPSAFTSSPVGDASWASACRRTANYPFSTTLGEWGAVTPESVDAYVALCQSASDSTVQGRIDADFCVETAGFPFLYHAGMRPQAAARLCSLLPARNLQGCLDYLLRSEAEDGAASSLSKSDLERAAAMG